MRHYEIVFLVHPDQRGQVLAMVERYRHLIESASGAIHRLEDWGRRQLAYPINKIHKAHYILMNIECDQATLDELESGFRFNDAILRSLTLVKKAAITEKSAIAIVTEEENKRPAPIETPVAAKPTLEVPVIETPTPETPTSEAPAIDEAVAVEQEQNPEPDAVESEVEDTEVATDSDSEETGEK